MGDYKLFTSLRYDPILATAPLEGFTKAAWNQKPSSYYMLDFHRDRMLRAASHWDWKSTIEVLSGNQGLKGLEEALDRATSAAAGDEPKRVKITLDRNGDLGIEFFPTPPLASLNNLFPSALPEPRIRVNAADKSTSHFPSKDPEWEILVDSKTTSRSEYTHYKTTSRGMYNDARKRAGIGAADKKEVLIINDTDGSIMEGSVTTPYLWRNRRWVTPPVSQTFSKEHGSGGNDGTSRRWALENNIAVEEIVMTKSLKDGEECWISNGVRGFIFGRVKIEK